MASLDETPIIDLGRNPVAGPQPAGADVSEDEEYIAAVAEMAKLGRIEADEPEWHIIERLGTGILRDKSKDVEIAAAVGIALFKQHSYAGLAAWMGLTTELINNFWDGLLPARPRRRKARIETVTDHFAERGWFGQNPPKGDDFDALDLCATRIAELEAALTARMPDDPPDFQKFVRNLTGECAKRPAPAAAPTAEPGAAAPAAVGGAEFAGAEPADRGSALSAVLHAAAFMRKADPSDPVPYALARSVKWSKIELPASDAAKYQIDPPEASLVETLQHQYGKQLWENLLKNAEAAFRSADPLWLDVQHYVGAAMRGLGEPYEKAHQAVVSATAGLVRRLGDGLYDLKFKTGTPLCSGEARMWIEAEVAAAAGSGGRADAVSAGNGRLGEASDQARKLVASGKLKEALAALQEGLAGCLQRRDRFLWRLKIAQLCFDAQRLQLAAPLLEECYEEIRRFGIDEWEPSLAVEVAQTLYRCRKSLVAAEKTPSPQSLERVRDSFAWLCQLDPVAALAAEPSGK